MHSVLRLTIEIAEPSHRYQASAALLLAQRQALHSQPRAQCHCVQCRSDPSAYAQHSRLNVWSLGAHRCLFDPFSDLFSSVHDRADRDYEIRCDRHVLLQGSLLRSKRLIWL